MKGAASGMKDEKTCIVLMNMGGPTDLGAVEPFLYNLFMDPDIISIPLGRFLRPFIARKIARKRSAKVRGYYEKIGGKSPLLELTRAQAAALEQALRGDGNFKTFVAMRYWHPFTEEAVRAVRAENPARVVLLPLYPHYSSTTTGSSLNEFRRVWTREGRGEVPVVTIEEWHAHEGYIASWVEIIGEMLRAAPGREAHLLFSAHGIPQSLVDGGDPYQRQTEETVRLILEALGWKGGWSLSYQSRVGPVKWLEPATDKLLVDLGRQGKERVIMVPISFVSDHSETLYEMDIQYRALAEASGIGVFERAPVPNCRESFISALRKIVLSRLPGAKGAA